MIMRESTVFTGSAFDGPGDNHVNITCLTVSHERIELVTALYRSLADALVGIDASKEPLWICGEKAV